MSTQKTINELIASNQQIYGNYTNEQIDKYFQEHNCKILRFPKDGYSENALTFYRNTDPKRIMYTTLSRFVKEPNKLYKKDYGYMRKHNIALTETTEQRLEKQKQEYENKLRESMLKEDCILTSKYEGYNKHVHYTYKNLDYRVTPTLWNSGVRPHFAKCIRYTHEHIAQLFEKEGCKLLTQYKNQKSKLTYEYNGKTYKVIYNDWKFYNCRPHLGQIHTYFTEELDKIEMQKNIRELKKKREELENKKIEDMLKEITEDTEIVKKEIIEEE
ncbi:hypothetical protein M9Y10_015738 [Tritrichomonas musculus]|uniref:Uncharacterized protein n=1 Tax=Tritrichomonas musculus TaxID=1915356 RepID=A0ABR2L412_9EUKA